MLGHRLDSKPPQASPGQIRSVAPRLWEELTEGGKEGGTAPRPCEGARGRGQGACARRAGPAEPPLPGARGRGECGQRWRYDAALRVSPAARPTHGPPGSCLLLQPGRRARAGRRRHPSSSSSSPFSSSSSPSSPGPLSGGPAPSPRQSGASSSSSRSRLCRTIGASAARVSPSAAPGPPCAAPGSGADSGSRRRQRAWGKERRWPRAAGRDSPPRALTEPSRSAASPSLPPAAPAGLWRRRSTKARGPARPGPAPRGARGRRGGAGPPRGFAARPSPLRRALRGQVRRARPLPRGGPAHGGFVNGSMLPAARAAAGQAGAAARPQPQRGHQLQLQLRALRLPQPPAALAGRHCCWARRPCPPAPEYRRGGEKMQHLIFLWLVIAEVIYLASLAMRTVSSVGFISISTASGLFFLSCNF